MKIDCCATQVLRLRLQLLYMFPYKHTHMMRRDRIPPIFLRLQNDMNYKYTHK